MTLEAPQMRMFRRTIVTSVLEATTLPAGQRRKAMINPTHAKAAGKWSAGTIPNWVIRHSERE